MQISQSVRARDAHWRIVDIRAYDDCRVVTLSGLTPPYVGAERRLIVPFDTLTPLDARARPRIVKASRWRLLCRALLAANRPPGGLMAAAHARIDLLPPQLEPALALVRGLGTRALLADEVGLGKTIQAGLVCAELLARGAIERALILAPAGLRHQWAQELKERFSIAATHVDAPTLRRLSATIPVGLNPWTIQPIVIASIDYIKRIEVLGSAAACLWDLVIVDEAHGVAGESDRCAAVSLLASRAAYVLLLTATPHSGDRRAFLSLCGIGSLAEDPLLIFRRSKADVRLGIERRIHLQWIRPSAAELHMHQALAEYCTAVRDERNETGDGAWLAMAVLQKRALSSAWALSQSIGRRLAALDEVDLSGRKGGKTWETLEALQMALPLDDPDGDALTADEPPAWPGALALADQSRERRLLIALAASARAAAAHETKVAALRRLLRRARQSAVVFTEYRDTLLHIAGGMRVPFVVLHGALTARERTEAIAAFTHSPRMVLLATDAAGEGLNLHQGCRLIINLELPWNPMRLEQRIGRVDRIGQRRRVHAFHLIARQAGEERILRRLEQRIAAAQSQIDVADPIGVHDDIAMARLLLEGALDDRGRSF